MIAPIAVFAYNRPDHLKNLLNSLLKNKDAVNSHVFIFCDGPKDPQSQDMCSKTRDVAYRIQGFGKKTVVCRRANLGLSKSIITGISEVLASNDRIVVLEDDLQLSPFFLEFMNESLDLYANVNSVGSINGYMYPIDRALAGPIFIRGSDCWGWGTWSRAWCVFERDGSKLLRRLKERNLSLAFDLDGAYPYTRMLEAQVKGWNDSWAIRWQASLFLENMYSLYPNKSLVNNVGHDNSGVHSGITNIFNVGLAKEKIIVEKYDVIECIEFKESLKRFYKKIRSPASRLKRLISRAINRPV